MSNPLDSLDFSVRAVKLTDAKVLSEIYEPYVSESAISFEIESPGVFELEKRIKDITALYPWLVLEVDGNVVAYAYASVFKARAAYDRTVETTVYVHKSFHGRGIGERLYLTLLNELRYREIVNAIAIIALPNDASVLFHEKLGFEPVGRLPAVGLKFGQWWDIGYWQLKLR